MKFIKVLILFGFITFLVNSCTSWSTGTMLYPDPKNLTTDRLCHKLETAYLAPLHIKKEWAEECRSRVGCYCLN